MKRLSRQLEDSLHTWRSEQQSSQTTPDRKDLPIGFASLEARQPKEAFQVNEEYQEGRLQEMEQALEVM